MQSKSANDPVQYGSPITLGLAKKVMAAAEAEAAANNWPVVIAIVDSGGNMVMVLKLDHAQLGSIYVAESKAKTSVNFKCATRFLEELLASGGRELCLLTMGEVLTLEGGFPLIMDGKIIGGIGVSGMMSDQDAQVALAGSNALAG
ncbi:MAG: heme-binding protein [Spirochaetes bacterium]|nr:heme-binding protein [Spirochaetota bacterium]